MKSDQSKLFVGGISRETSEDALEEHFEAYGSVSGSIVARDRCTKNSRGFGFVWFCDRSSADRALQDKHIILGRTVEVKKAVPRTEHVPNQQRSSRGSSMSGRNEFNNYQNSTKKIFVGGLSASLTEDEFRNYFEKYGRISDLVVMHDSVTQRPRGFGFITFDSEEAVENVMKKSFHELSGGFVEVKRAIPKEVKNITGYNNSTEGVKDVRAYVDNNAVQIPGHYPLMGPSFGSVPLHGGPPCYGRVVGNVYGSWYPMGGVYSGTGYGAPPFMHRGVLFNPRMMGTRMWQLPYGSAPIHHAYWNSGIGYLGTVVDNTVVGNVPS